MAEGHAVAVKWKMDSLTILRDSEQVEKKKTVLPVWLFDRVQYKEKRYNHFIYSWIARL